MVMTRAHSFPRAAEFRAEPRNFRVFAEFRRILRKHGNSATTAKFRKAVIAVVIVTRSPFGQIHRPVDFSDAFSSSVCLFSQVFTYWTFVGEDD